MPASEASPLLAKRGGIPSDETAHWQARAWQGKTRYVGGAGLREDAACLDAQTPSRSEHLKRGMLRPVSTDNHLLRVFRDSKSGAMVRTNRRSANN